MNGQELRKLVSGSAFEVVRETKTFVQVLRGDGFTVFLDKYEPGDANAEIYELLNYARVNAEPDDVILMVGIVRGLQIAKSYRDRERVQSEKLDKILSAIPVLRSLISGISQKKRQKKLKLEGAA